jgi:radical SAM/CxCxxxxC motif protein YfkAB
MARTDSARKEGLVAVKQVELQPITPEYDPWDPIRSLREYGTHVLTSVELTTTHLCNMRCEHCAVGDALTIKEAQHLPLETVLKMLDQVEHLQTLSITGGEPSYDALAWKNYVLPILKYARDRGVRTQINSNLTLTLERYELIAPWLDVMHISYNYLGAEDFWEIGFANTSHSVSVGQATRMFEQMITNVRQLSAGGLYISAESMMNTKTHLHLADMHAAIVEMGCRRHEVHPMYPTSFASTLPILTLDEMRKAIHALLDKRDPSIWLLFGTLPFFACSPESADRDLWWRLQDEHNVTVRNDPDGRNRLNVDTFTGKVSVTDFKDLTQIASVFEAPYSLDAIFAVWKNHPTYARLACYCPAANCCGPNLLVADAYYREINFTRREAKER